MRQVSIAEAAKRLFALLDEVERGERIVIVRGGKRIARLLPVSDIAEDVPALIARMKAARAKRERWVWPRSSPHATKAGGSRAALRPSA